MPNTNGAATELAPLLDGSTAGELIPELVRRGLQQLIELEVRSISDRGERSRLQESMRGYRHDTTQLKEDFENIALVTVSIVGSGMAFRVDGGQVVEYSR